MPRSSRRGGLPALVRSLVLLPSVLAAGALHAAVNVVASTEDLAALTREVGGDKVKVDAIARGYQDPHFVEAKPSFIFKLHAADLLVVVGKELELGWLPALVQQSRNARIQPGADGYLDASLSARILDIPTGPITRAMGDVHPTGNPHYWLDPGNGRRIAQAVQAKLSAMRPDDGAYFAARYADFDRRLREGEKRWDARMAPCRGAKIVTYHRSWSNFVERFGLDVIDYVEPRPGVPPSPSHTIELIRKIRREGVKVLLVEPYFDLKTPAAIGRETGARVLVLPPSVGGEQEIRDYVALFDHNIALLVAALEGGGAAR
jgi:zinc/manganese transport system substrate-binding protein